MQHGKLPEANWIFYSEKHIHNSGFGYIIPKECAKRYPELVEIVEGCLTLDPARRPTFQQLRMRFNEFLGNGFDKAADVSALRAGRRLDAEKEAQHRLHDLSKDEYKLGFAFRQHHEEANQADQ
jgi:hypothetical protein